MERMEGTPPRSCCSAAGAGPHPAPTWIQRSWRFSGSGQTVSGHLAFSATAPTAATNSSLSSTLGRETGCGSRSGTRHHAAARLPRTHLQTKTSSGAAVLGVMIHGATRKTTVSVKIGISSKPWVGREETTAFGLRSLHPAYGSSRPPATAGTFSGLSSSVTWKATSPAKPTSGKASPST